MKILNKEIEIENIEEFLSDERKCLKVIADIKWQQGYTCLKCGHTNYCEGKTPFSRRCTRCKKEESATAHTIFHNCKFPITKAFYIAYSICGLRENISSHVFSKKLSLRTMTCWKFKKKIELFVKQNTELSGHDKSVLFKILSEPIELNKKE